MSENIIQTTALNYSFDQRKILKDLTLEVPKGSIYGFLGPNGAGKTTTIRLLLGLLKVKEAQIHLFGKDIRRNALEIYSRTGSLIEKPSLYGHLNGNENLELCRRLCGAPYSRIQEVLRIVEMSTHAHTKIRKYSLGMKQRLGLALALIQNPELLILDEPTNGLDPSGIIEMRKLLLKLNQDFGKTIFLSSHILSEIELLVTHIGIIDLGELKFQGSLHELQNLSQPKLRISTNNSEKASKLLKQKEINISKQTGQFVEIGIKDEKQIASLNEYLVANNLHIYGLQMNNQKLENIFLNLTNTIDA
ncbi:ABC transporter ATP-binding protein [Xanthovirga aplysinae]|uniref:ABC transporter ATP-binding protein n=1 Tax=Xanthovirga aplysinae TaxID=2529853 RepID=UPI0012BCA488|nr:ATP-binding cassette domain-containing protein [Xanthovirga aplysinae]MTI33508.1 ATP-binding cassette domain-containing protein [Xanthovirga aplysinae]